MNWYKTSAPDRIFDCKIYNSTSVLLQERRTAKSPEQAESHLWHKAARLYGRPNTPMPVRINMLKERYRFQCSEVLPELQKPPAPPPKDPQGYLFNP